MLQANPILNDVADYIEERLPLLLCDRIPADTGNPTNEWATGIVNKNESWLIGPNHAYLISTRPVVAEMIDCLNMLRGKRNIIRRDLIKCELHFPDWYLDGTPDPELYNTNE